MKRQLTLERTYHAPLDLIWELWTTRDGIESWWGPEGFQTTVQKLELKVGGTLIYTFTAVGPEQIAFMKQSGQPLEQRLTARYTVVEPMTCVAWSNLADFIPGVTPYEVETRVELKETAAGVHLTLKFDAMHEEKWTQLAAAGWQSELGKLEKAITARRKNP